MTTPPDLQALRIERRVEPEPSTLRLWVSRLLVIAVILGAGGAAWNWVPRTLRVQVAQVVVTGGPKQASAGLSAAGYVVARRSSEVAASVPGRLVQILVDEGETVTQGQLLARLDSDDLTVQLQAAKAQLAQVQSQIPPAERTLARAESLLAGEAGTALDTERARDSLDILMAQGETALAQVRVVEVSLRNTEIRAPFAGTILRKRLEVGEYLSPGGFGGVGGATGVVELADLTTLELDADVNEVYIARVSQGMDALVVLDAAPDRPYAARVRTIVPTADRQKATVRVRVAILEPDARILPDMGAKVTFLEGDEPDAVVEPRQVLLSKNAAVSDGGQMAVWVVQEGKAQRRSIEVSGEAKGDLVVSVGLQGGETVVLSPSEALRDGVAVTTGI